MSGTQINTAQALKAWKAGEPVFTCEMGGMGPGYEQCIQVMAFDMIEAMEANPFDWKAYDAATDDKKAVLWETYRDKIDAATKATVERLGPSGAQFGAALSLAAMVHRHGYAGAMATVPQDRLIQASRSFPA